MKKNGILILVLVLVVSVVSVVMGTSYLNRKSEKVLSVGESQQEIVVESVLESKMPFVEMTIPYLRARKYDSRLGLLKKVGEKSAYTMYTTSYDSDGFAVNGLLTVPKGNVPKGGHPAIVFVHGYIPPEQYKTLEKYTDYVDYLARNGFVVFKIDLRGHGSSEGEPGGAYYSADYVIDALNARAALSKNALINPDKIGMWGHSMAGNVLLRSVTSQTSIPAVVIWAGAGFTYTDLSAYRINDRSYRSPELTSLRAKRRQELRNKHGDFSLTSEFWRQVAPTDYMGDIKGAIQLHHAVNDTVVSVEYSRNLAKLLDEKSVSHELYEYKSGGHNVIGESFDLAMRRTVDFFKTKLEVKN